MAKKSKKHRRPNVPAYTGPVSGTARASGRPAAQPAAAAAPSVIRHEGISADYAHVIKDLKRIGLLAGAFIGLMVIASFFVK